VAESGDGRHLGLTWCPACNRISLMNPHPRGVKCAVCGTRWTEAELRETRLLLRSIGFPIPTPPIPDILQEA
jgi:hypothetical protein